jgi:hypothetical protein
MKSRHCKQKLANPSMEGEQSNGISNSDEHFVDGVAEESTR